MQDQHFRYYMENVQQSQFVNQQRQIEQVSFVIILFFVKLALMASCT